MRVLVVGSGAREHALAAHLAAEPEVREVLAAPGNPGIAGCAQTLPVDPQDPDALGRLADRLAPDLVVIGPELPLVAGGADALRARGHACFGPDAAAARIEGSKAFAKDVMARAGVRTARSQVFGAGEVARALDALAGAQPPYVVKYDGLAAGKGVTVTSDLSAAGAAVCAALADPGARVLIEDFLDGPEVSLFAVTDGASAEPLLPAQDFKRLRDRDAGPNTGGMGSYAPLPWAPAELAQQVVEEVVTPTLRELAARGTPFRGLLYAGLALTADGPAVVEFNARFGDPETQSVLALLASPLAPLLHAAATGDLASVEAPRWSAGAAVTVVLAAPGYPEAPRTGGELAGLDEAGHVEGVNVYHAGTARRDGRLVASGGRVLSVTARGADLAAAREGAYRALDLVQLAGGQARRDIALDAAGAEPAGAARR